MIRIRPASTFRRGFISFLMVLTVASSLSGCLKSKIPLDPEYELRDINDYVKLTPVEAGAPDNAHPRPISGSEIRLKLSKLAATGNLGYGDDPVALFTPGELARISGPLATALSRAAPNQDIVFRSGGARGLFGRYSTPSFTTGRVFVRDGSLNIILGVAHQKHDDSIDENYAPEFRPGSRAERVETGWDLVDGEGVIIEERGDWAKFTLDEHEAGMTSTSESPGANPLPLPKTGDGVPPQPGEAESIVRERSQGIENRLRVLDDLRQRGLVTEQEYNSQRKAILNDI